ncbi:MAG: tetratricopeptide repeat protein [Bacteroidia bacterium]|nr:tetratricopeptide repeat protein [Bacteroidia bacterium]
MKKLFLLFVMLAFAWTNFAQYQMPSDIKRIMEKVSSGKELTEQESARLEEWGDTMSKQYEKQENEDRKQGSQTQGAESPKVESTIQKGNKPCPELIKLTATSLLTRDQYIQLAQSLLTTYGPKTGDLQKLKQKLEQSDRQTDGADMGAAFVMTGAGSASVYAIAWSAVRSPDDLLTANNLGVALKDMGEYAKAIQILQYADHLKPNIGLVLCNLGWAYWEAGDQTNATAMFEKALRVAPKMSSPYLGLGLIAQCEKNNVKAEQYLRKALRQKYSAVGFAAMAKAQEANSASQQQPSTPRPLVDEKGDSRGLEIPDLPVYENKSMMAGQEQPLKLYLTQLGAREQQLLSRLLSAAERMRNQQLHASRDPDNSMVFSRDFAKGIMQFEDICGLLFGENSNYARASRQGSKLVEDNAKRMEQHLPMLAQDQEKHLQMLDQMQALMEEGIKCGDNEYCQKQVEAKIKKLQYEIDLLVFKMCKLQKGDLESSFSAACKNYALVSGALKEAISDLYAFSNPIIEQMYAPSINEYYNLYREMIALSHLKIAAGFASGIPPIANQLNELICVEPEPPQPPESPADPTLPTQEKKDCPLGENGLSGGMGVLSFELSCEHVKLSGGEGLLWSVKRDFNKHETTIWGGVGVKGEYGSGTLSAEASLGMEITLGQGDSVKDVAFTSNVKAGVGGLAEGEISGRFALEGEPSVSADANFTPPGISDLLGN